MKEVIFALLAGGLGVLLLTAGYRFARILIPLWAFFAGFSVGAAVFADATSVGFIATTMGIVTGLIIGFVFALFAYFFYSLAVVLLGATTGYWIGTAFMSWIGFSKGFLSAVVGISLGVVFALATIGLNVAKYLFTRTCYNLINSKIVVNCSLHFLVVLLLIDIANILLCL